MDVSVYRRKENKIHMKEEKTYLGFMFLPDYCSFIGKKLLPNTSSGDGAAGQAGAVGQLRSRQPTIQLKKNYSTI